MARNDPSATTLRSFLTSIAVLAVLMLAAGILTLVVPSGAFERVPDADGDLVVVPGTYRAVDRPDYPAWRWLTAPVEVLGGEDAPVAIVIIAFIVVVGGAFAVMREAGVLEESVRSLARRFRDRRMAMLAVLCFFFMLIGSFMGIFEEVIPLVPLAIGLSLSFGWDVFAGLGMSILAVGFGFSAAVANPFSIGTAQRLAGVPVLSGAGFRLVAFACIYALYLVFMIAYVRRLEAGKPSAVRTVQEAEDGTEAAGTSAAHRGAAFFGWASAVLAVVVMASSITGVGSDYVLPVIALGFLVIGVGAGLRAGLKPGRVLAAFARGALDVAPAGLLILMALGVKRIIVSGGVMDTILDAAARAIAGASGYGAAAMMYGITLGMNFFIGSASAKAFLLMPILAPLADLSGVSRQVAVQAFAFGDGFSNMLYPTNPVLLISLGLAGMPWGAWLGKTWKLQAGTLVLTMALLMAAVAIGYR